MSESNTRSTPRVRAVPYAELHTGEPLQWLWEGYLAPGNITVLTSQWKSGKTTLLAALLNKLKDGGTLAGRPVRAGHAVVVSEESRALWFERGKRFDYAGQVRWLCRPFCGKPSQDQFSDFVDELIAMHADAPFTLLAIDSLASFLPPGCENNADAIMTFLGSLQRLAALGVAIFILHHPRKHATREGQAARGSGALLAAVDVLMEMHWLGRPSAPDRRRRLKAWSRHDHTPPRLVIELNESGTDYSVVDNPVSAPKLYALPDPLHQLLMAASLKLTVQQILDRWPKHLRPPSPNLLWRWLDRGCKHDLVKRDAAGVAGDPYRYWLPEREKQWREDPILSLAIDNYEKWQRQQQQKAAAHSPPAAQPNPPLSLSPNVGEGP